MNEPRDTLVGDALRRLDVPDHAPGFWDRLEGGLAAGAPDAPGDDAGGGDGCRPGVIELDGARPSRATRAVRSGHRPAIAAVAAAAAAIALAVGIPAAQQAADGDAKVDVADAPDVPAPDARQPAPEDGATPPAETTTTTEPDPEALQLVAEELAGEWLTLLRAGDIDAAHALLDDASRERLPIDELRGLSSGLAEGAGAFAGDGVTATVAIFDGPGGAPLWVVTFTGEVAREGMVEFASLPVVITGEGDELAVHLDVAGPTLEVDTEVVSGTTLTSPLPLLVSPTAELWVSYDGRVPEPVDQAGRASIELDVSVAGGGGTHVVTLVGHDGDRITARAYPVMIP